MANKYGLPKGVRLISGSYRWEARYNGQRVTGSSKVLESAVAERTEAINALQIGQVPNSITPVRTITQRQQKDECPTLKEAIDQMKRTDWKDAKSFRSIDVNTKYVMEYFGPDTKLYEITSTAIDKYVAWQQDNGSASGTCNRKISIVSKILKRAYKKGQIDKMPYVERQKESEGRIRYITQEEELNILENVKDNARVRDVIIILIDTGMRIGELFKLRSEDIVDNQGPHGIVYLHETKNGTSRGVPLTLRAKEALKRCIESSKDKEQIFTEDIFWMTRQWNKIRKALGYTDDPNFVPHILRHTCCSRLVQRGAPLKKVQVWMGHKSIITTMRYAHLSPTELYDMTSLLEEESGAQNDPD